MVVSCIFDSKEKQQRIECVPGIIKLDLMLDRSIIDDVEVGTIFFSFFYPLPQEKIDIHDTS